MNLPQELVQEQAGSTVFFGIKEKNFTGSGIKVEANLSLSDDGVKRSFFY